MKISVLEAGRRFREKGQVAEALKCLGAALDGNRDSIEVYVELALTYILAFEESGDPLCLDSARKICISALRRQPTEAERRRLFEIQDRVEDLILESQKAEMDAMADALDDGTIAEGPPDVPDEEDTFGEDPRGERGH